MHMDLKDLEVHLRELCKHEVQHLKCWASHTMVYMSGYQSPWVAVYIAVSVAAPAVGGTVGKLLVLQQVDSWSAKCSC